MTERERNALCGFMISTLKLQHPNLDEYPLGEINNIDESEGDESPLLDDLPEYAVRAYYQMRNIEIIRGHSIWF